MKERIEELLEDVPGIVAVYYKNLVTDEELVVNGDYEFVAASVIKLPVLIETLRQLEEGSLNLEELYVVEEEDKVPGCGTLQYMHEGFQVNIEDLYNLMIIISDNTATNMLMDICGIENINRTMRDLGLRNTEVMRKLYDLNSDKRSNYFSVRDIGSLLEKTFREDLLSRDIAREVDKVLLRQQLDSKIPYLLPADVEIGHKTGEVTNTTHDVGIVYAKEPFVICFASNDTDVVVAEEALRKIALECFEYSNK